MIFHLDKSVVVAALTKEPRTARVQTWLADQGADDLFISEWRATERSSAMSIKLRTGQIATTDRWQP